jgi:hypothetical protein
MQDLRIRLRTIILGITGLIVVFLVFRIILEILDANQGNFLISFFFSVSSFFLAPFVGAVPGTIASVIPQLNFDAVIAILLYILIGVGVSEVFTSFLHESGEEIIVHFLDALLKMMEFLIFFRIVIDLFGLFPRATAPGFIQFVYASTDWTTGIFSGIKVASGVVNLSSITVLVILAIMDIYLERTLRGLFTSLKRR